MSSGQVTDGVCSLILEARMGHTHTHTHTDIQALDARLCTLEATDILSERLSLWLSDFLLFGVGD